MSKFAAFMAALMIIAIGFGVPAVTIYFTVNYSFNEIIAGIICFFSIAGAFVLGIVGLGEGIFSFPSEDSSRIYREKLNMLRAHQRATLEELDEIAEILREIRDALKEAQEVE
ncbi:MAG: hypothetical protein DRJ26_03400 [Candidatus Methanomethylicota archaeon]|uniref:Uncharacterized protein n=1 Tax=Thermoproteota archaeon TaxID=2056631 RepID=A0A497F3D7_9CREN|nr:MAG: hypothetical protein DRJ26_03400 [Candidatus Verstraetearchaeota archaeon]